MPLSCPRQQPRSSTRRRPSSKRAWRHCRWLGSTPDIYGPGRGACDVPFSLFSFRSKNMYITHCGIENCIHTFL